MRGPFSVTCLHHRAVSTLEKYTLLCDCKGYLHGLWSTPSEVYRLGLIAPRLGCPLLVVQAYFSQPPPTPCHCSQRPNQWFQQHHRAKIRNGPRSKGIQRSRSTVRGYWSSPPALGKARPRPSQHATACSSCASTLSATYTPAISTAHCCYRPAASAGSCLASRRSTTHRATGALEFAIVHRLWTV